MWIDPPRRSAPDGSAFQLQHWTHEFRYALVSSAGDWREAALPARGQEFSTPLLPVVANPSPGDLPGRHSLLSVEPARQVLVATVKAAGNPVAQGRSRPVDPARATTVRLVQATGLATRARLTWTTTPLRSAHRADLLEVPRRRLDVADGAVELDLDGSAIETLVVTLGTAPRPPQAPAPGPAPAPSPAPAPGGRPPPVLGPASELAQPTFSRYWLHNRGPAPMGFLPVAVTVAPALARCAAGGRFEVGLVVTNQYADAPVDVEGALHLPDGWTASAPHLRTRLAAGGYARFRSWVEVPADAPPGQYAVTARIAPATAGLAGGAGVALVEDVTTVFVGDSAAATDALAFTLPTAAHLARRDQAGALATDMPRSTGLDVAVSTTTLRLVPGVATSLVVTLASSTLSPIRAEVQIASPWGTWDWLADPVRSVTVPPGEISELPVLLRPPADTGAGHAWLLPKVMWFGRAQYGETVHLVVQR